MQFTANKYFQTKYFSQKIAHGLILQHESIKVKLSPKKSFKTTLNTP
jgi:hypothetical protein